MKALVGTTIRRVWTAHAIGVCLGSLFLVTGCGNETGSSFLSSHTLITGGETGYIPPPPGDPSSTGETGYIAPPGSTTSSDTDGGTTTGSTGSTDTSGGTTDSTDSGGTTTGSTPTDSGSTSGSTESETGTSDGGSISPPSSSDGTATDGGSIAPPSGEPNGSDGGVIASGDGSTTGDSGSTDGGTSGSADGGSSGSTDGSGTGSTDGGASGTTDPGATDGGSIDGPTTDPSATDGGTRPATGDIDGSDGGSVTPGDGTSSGDGGSTGGTTDGGSIGTGGDSGSTDGAGVDGGDTSAPYCAKPSGLVRFKLNQVGSNSKDQITFAQAAEPILAIEARVPPEDIEKNPQSYYKNGGSAVGPAYYAKLQQMPTVLLKTVDLKAENYFGPKFRGSLAVPYGDINWNEAASKLPRGWRKVLVAFYVCDDTDGDGMCSDEDFEDQVLLNPPSFKACHLPHAVVAPIR